MKLPTQGMLPLAPPHGAAFQMQMDGSIMLQFAYDNIDAIDEWAQNLSLVVRETKRIYQGLSETSE